MNHFSDPQAIADYAARTLKIVPGLGDLHRMAALLLAERMPLDGRVLVVGAGGGLELKAFAESHPDWRFTGVDPSAAMLELARQHLGPLASRVEMHHGYVSTAPNGPFDAATCLLTLHFLPVEERRQTLCEIRRRLRPDAAFVAMHLSVAQLQPERSQWLTRYAAFAAAADVAPEKAQSAAAAIERQLPILSPEQDEALLREAGFSSLGVFYVGLAFRGWVAYA